MISSCGSNIGRRGWWVWLAVLVLGMLGAGGLQAQTTAKLEGRVRDQAGAPVASAQVRIQGSAYFAEANSQGYYFINNVVAGTYTVEARFVGYKAVAVTGLKLVGGQTITQDFTIEQTAIEITEIEVIAASNPLVPRDEVTSKQRVDGEFTNNLPVDRLTNVLALQPGVVASAGGGTITIRGGRPDEAVTYIDGVPVSGGLRGNYANSRSCGGRTDAGEVQVSTNAFEAASVTTGALSSEFGNGQSGMISVTTRSGGSRFNGSVAYETDEPLGSQHGPGFNRVEGSLGGPISKNLSFFVSGVLEGRQAFDRGFTAEKTPEYVLAGVDTTFQVPTAYNTPTADVSAVEFPNFAIYSGDCDDVSGSSNSGISDNYGIDCQGIRSAYSPRGTYQLTGKLNYTFGSGNRVSFTALRNLTQTRFANNGVVLAPQLLTAAKTVNSAYIVNWTQNLSKSADRALALELFGSYQEDKLNQGVLDPSNERDTRTAPGGFLALKKLDFLFDFDDFDVDDALIQTWRTGGPGQVPLEPGEPYGSSNIYRLNPYGLDPATYGNSGASSPISNLVLSRERRYIGRANLDWQVDRYNRLKIGGEFTKYKFNHYSRGMNNQTLCFCDAYVEQPVRYDAFIENRLDLGDVIVVGGLRYDFFDSRASRPFLVDSGYQFPTHYSTNAATLRRDKSHDYISPHLQVSFPVTERTNFRLSYAHQVQAPDFSLVLGGINTDLDATNSNQLFGTDLDFQKTITFEFGVRHQFSEDMVLDVAAYNKDKLADATARIFKIYNPINGLSDDEFRAYTNLDFGTVRGIDVRLDRRFGSLFNGSLAYTFQDAKNTGTDPNSYVSFFADIATADGKQPVPPQAILPSTDSRPHNLAGSFSLSFPGNWHEGSTIGTVLENVGLFATFRVASGTAYTRCPADPVNPRSSLLVTSGNLCDGGDFGGADINTDRLPMFKQFDLRVSKGFSIGGNQLTLYADARNLFNFENTLQVYTVSGTTDTDGAFDIIRFPGDSVSLFNEATFNGVWNAADGSMDLSAVGVCDFWTNTGATPAGPNCLSLRRAEERFGNSDGIYTNSEQRAASRAFFDLGTGLHNHLGSPRRIRLGIEFNF